MSDVFAHGIVQHFGGDRLVVIVAGKVRDQHLDAVFLEVLVSKPSGVLLGTSALCMRAGPAQQQTCENLALR